MVDTWEAGAEWAVTAIRAFASVYVTDVDPLTDVRVFFDWMEKWGSYSSHDFIALGGRAWAGLTAWTTVTPAAVVELLARKQHDYGPQNILRYGQHGIRIRIHDKIARLENLAKRDNEASNESVIDTWLDIVGYCVVAVMLQRGTFQLPLAADAAQS